MLDFAWAEWSQMGLPAGTRSDSAWAQDPEALVVFTLELGRDDPRLFDEVMSWIAANETLLSVRRLRAMCAGPEDAVLVDAARRWLEGIEPGEPEKSGQPDHGRMEPLFRGLTATGVRELDPAFAAAGFLRPRLERGAHAGAPDLRKPINLAFRLRYLLGVSVRAEVVRHLLTVRGEFVTTQAIAGSAGYARRNVQEALAALRRAGVVEVRTSPGFMHWGTDPARWGALLELDEPPTYRDWPHLLSGLREVLRWLGRADLDDLSEYLLGSQAQDLLERVGDPLQRAGVTVRDTNGAGAWNVLEAAIASALVLLDEM